MRLGICTYAVTQLSLLTKQSGEVDEPGYLYLCYHPTVASYYIYASFVTPTLEHFKMLPEHFKMLQSGGDKAGIYI